MKMVCILWFLWLSKPFHNYCAKLFFKNIIEQHNNEVILTATASTEYNISTARNSRIYIVVRKKVKYVHFSMDYKIYSFSQYFKKLHPSLTLLTID